MNNIVILGDGLLGKELVNQTNWDNISRKKDGFDITDTSTFNLLLETFDGVAQKSKYTTIINCIANTNTYSNDRKAHWDVNYKGVAELVDFCNKWSIKLVHISTDYVYANSLGTPTELDPPSPQSTHYAHTKLLADGYVELKSQNHLIIRATHKPTPFPYDKAWIDQLGNFDTVDIITQGIVKAIQKEVNGILNVGTEFKSMYNLAKRTNPNVLPARNNDVKIPLNTTMDVTKFQNL